MNSLKLQILLVVSAMIQPVEAQVPQLLNFQGRVMSGGAAFDGSGAFKFALVNGQGNVTYWANDGVSTGGGEPGSAVALPVTKGLYSVLLGDSTVPNMAAIPTGVFNNPDVRLRVWFNDGKNGVQVLTPDQRIAAVGYAITAGSAATVPSGAIGTAQIALEAITNSQLASNAVQSGNIAPGAIGSIQLAPSSVTNSALANASVDITKLSPRTSALATNPQTPAAAGSVAVSGSVTYSTGSKTDILVPGLSVTLNTTGRPVVVCLIPAPGSNLTSFWGAATENQYASYVEIKRDSDTIATYSLRSGGNLIYVPAGCVSTIDMATAGNHTYSILLTAGASTNDITVLNNVVLCAYEL